MWDVSQHPVLLGVSPFMTMAIPITTTPHRLLIKVMPVFEMSTGHWSFASSSLWSNRSTTAMILFNTTPMCSSCWWPNSSYLDGRPCTSLPQQNITIRAINISPYPLTCKGSGYSRSRTKVPRGEALRITMTSDMGAFFKASIEVSNMAQYIGATMLQRNKSLRDPTWM